MSIQKLLLGVQLAFLLYVAIMVGLLSEDTAALLKEKQRREIFES